MLRRTFFQSGLVAAAGLAGCGLGPPAGLTVVCDMDLRLPLIHAAALWPDRRNGPYDVRSDQTERALGLRMEALDGGLVVTREPKQANRLQRMGLARLDHRWTRTLGGGEIILIATRGDFRRQSRAIAFARWLASPAADPALSLPDRAPRDVAALSGP